MRITFLIGEFPPEISTSRLGFQLCKRFLKSGNAVTVLTSFPRRYLVDNKTDSPAIFLYRENIDGLNVIRMGPEFSNRDNMNMRGFEYFFQFFSFLVGGLFSGETDVIMCCSPPLTLALASLFLGKIKRVPVVVRIGDLHPQELVDLGLVKNKLIVHLLRVIEKIVYQKSDYITVLSEGYRQHLLSKETNASKVLVLSNWGDPDEIDELIKRPETAKKNKFVVTYAGIISWAQDLDTLIDAANLLKENKDISFLIVGDGPNKRALQTKCKSLELANTTFLPLQPREEYIRILHDSNVCVVAIKQELTTTTIPSKIFDILSCERPLLAIVPEGEVTDLIKKAECGYWIKPGDSRAVADKVTTLYKTPKLGDDLGRNGRKYLEANFTLTVVSKKHEEIMVQLIKAKHARINIQSEAREVF